MRTLSVVLMLLAGCGDATAPERAPKPPPASPSPHEAVPWENIVDEGTRAEGTPAFDDEACAAWAEKACECGSAPCQAVRAHHTALGIARDASDVREVAQLVQMCEQMNVHFRCSQ
jgi:hypothetical protein